MFDYGDGVGGFVRQAYWAPYALKPIYYSVKNFIDSQ